MKISMDAIQDVCNQIVAQFQPLKVILFGSYAEGRANEDSDVDLIVVLPFQGHPFDMRLRIRRALQYHFPLDLLVYQPQDVSEESLSLDPFVHAALTRGKTLYEHHA